MTALIDGVKLKIFWKICKTNIILLLTISVSYIYVLYKALMFSVLMFQLQCAVQSGFRNSGISLGKKGKIIVVCKILGFSYQEGRVGIPLTSSTLPHLLCLS